MPRCLVCKTRPSSWLFEDYTTILPLHRRSTGSFRKARSGAEVHQTREGDRRRMAGREVQPSSGSHWEAIRATFQIGGWPRSSAALVQRVSREVSRNPTAVGKSRTSPGREVGCRCAQLDAPHGCASCVLCLYPTRMQECHVPCPSYRCLASPVSVRAATSYKGGPLQLVQLAPMNDLLSTQGFGLVAYRGGPLYTATSSFS